MFWIFIGFAFLVINRFFDLVFRNVIDNLDFLYCSLPILDGFVVVAIVVIISRPYCSCTMCCRCCGSLCS